MTDFACADICDAHATAQVLQPGFQHFGARQCFHGDIVTIKLFEDNSVLKTLLQEAGLGRVIVVDGGGSKRCALLGGNLAELAAQSGWAGLIINGCVRDSVEIALSNVGVLALGSHPRRSEKRNEGQTHITVEFGGVRFAPGQHVYVDEDGAVITEKPIL